MATVYEIVQGLSQAAANAYDGALDESGEPIKAGLQREEGEAAPFRRLRRAARVLLIRRVSRSLDPRLGSGRAMSVSSKRR